MAVVVIAGPKKILVFANCTSLDFELVLHLAVRIYVMTIRAKASVCIETGTSSRRFFADWTDCSFTIFRFLRCGSWGRIITLDLHDVRVAFLENLLACDVVVHELFA